jgi:thiamine-monophosphate kinase
MKSKRNENEVVAKIERRFGLAKRNGLVLSLGDDAALWKATSGWRTVLTCDWFLEGTHFLRDKHPADAVGWKCLARAVSDIAAMGGEPRCFLLSLALPGELTGKWLDRFLGGLRRASRALGCEMAGGDTTKRDEVLINVTVIGEVRRGLEIRRSGARAGDLLFVSGTLGEADLELRQLRRTRGMAKPENAALRKHLYPRPRLELGRWIAEKRLASAMMDLSDGLSTDLSRLCAASGLGARINADSLPVSLLAKSSDAEALALHGGDDYELLFAVRRKNAGLVPRRFRGLRLTQIGEITKARKLLLTTGDKTIPLTSGGWDPFLRN